jgi:ferredoxin-nitrate reductase
MSSPETIRTTCSYCGVGCGMRVSRDRTGRLRLEGDEQHPVNRGMLCSKGQALHHVVQDTSDRLLYPQMRASRAHPMERVDWDSALARAAAVFKATIARFGPESVGFYVSGQCLTEEYYVVNKLMKGFIGSNNIDTNSRLCMSSAVAGYKLALGDDAFPLSYDDIELGSCFLIAGANPAWCHPILFRRLEQHKERHPDTRIIVVDPRRTQSCAIADLHLQLNPGTDVVLYNALARILMESGQIDQSFIDAHTEGFEQARAAAMTLSVAEAALCCGVSVGDLRRAAEMIGESKAFQSWWAMGLNQSAVGVDKNLALLNLSLLTGQIGKPGAGPFSLTGQPNAMGGREVGGMANLLAAHHDLANAEHREKVARYWGGGSISPKPGLTATEMFDALASGALRAVWIICTNPAVSLPNLKGVDEALRKARFVVVQDISNRSETAQHADLLLPAAGWLEKRGTMTNSERRVTLVEKLLEAPGEALPDVEILCRFAKHMGWGAAFDYPDEAAIFDEHTALTAGTVIDMRGISHARLRREGSLQWPCPEASHPGTARLFEDARFYTPSQRARLHGVEPRNDSEPLSGDYPLILTTGRLRDQWHTMTRTGKVNKLRQQDDAPFVEMHPADAQRRELRDGQTVRVCSARGDLLARLRVTDSIKPGAVFLPMHFGRAYHGEAARANLLTSPCLDPRSKEPDFKYAAVDVHPVCVPRREIIVIGGGAAALQFITTYREHNTSDIITVFGREAAPFYNRIHLPEYLSGARAWEELITCDSTQAARLNVRVMQGLSISSIDRPARCVMDEHGRRHYYDVLVLATGSRAALPAGAPLSMEGVHTLRSRPDADALRAQAQPGTHAVVVGGGLLGIEAAGALAERGVRVTLLHRSGKLMGAQLNDTASRLLRESLLDLGIEVLLSEGIRHVHGEDRVLGVRTASGRYLSCELLLYAVGTRPNDELARAAGLRCGEGVVVDDGLRTSDPAIHAIGEVAEHAGIRHGTTLAAQQQAAVAAARIAGDPWACYRGSTPVNVLKVKGVPLATMGMSTLPSQAGPEYEEIVFHDERQRAYLKCVVRDDTLAGAILLGDTTLLPHFKELIESGAELDGARAMLLRPGGDTTREPLRGRVVCSCNQVGEDNIADAVALGCGSLESVCGKTRAGTGCGSCRPEVAQLLARLAPPAPVLAAGALP